MNKREAQIISAYTGILVAPSFSWFHEYVEELIGRPVFTHEFASEELMAQIKEKARPDFVKLIEGIEDDDNSDT